MSKRTLIVIVVLSILLLALAMHTLDLPGIFRVLNPHA